MKRSSLTFIFLVFVIHSVFSKLEKKLEIPTTIKKSKGVSIKQEPQKLVATFNLKNDYSWFSFPFTSSTNTKKEWHYLEADISNLGNQELEIILWVSGERGWYAVSDLHLIKRNSKQHFSCNLKESFPDGTYKLIPGRIKEIKVMLKNGLPNQTIELTNLKVRELDTVWEAHDGRIEIPEVSNNKPSSGERVKYQLSSDLSSERYSVLYLPLNWNPDKKYPIIVEFPGNIYYTKDCYSTGEPDQCQIGYGMSKGDGAIWISIPFIDYTKKENILNGWGNPDDTADYTLKTVLEISKKYQGDIKNVIITGFSRGAIACRFIGLRNKEIAKLWKGFHECQHFDGDGWKGATLESAKKRLNHLGERPLFQTDNHQPELKKMLKNKKVIYANSGLKFHATTMFLDNRESTVALRKWFNNIIK